MNIASTMIDGVKDLLKGPKLRRSKDMVIYHVCIVFVYYIPLSMFRLMLDAFKNLLFLTYIIVWVYYLISISVVIIERRQLLEKGEELPSSLDLIYFLYLIVFFAYVCLWFFLRWLMDVSWW